MMLNPAVKESLSSGVKSQRASFKVLLYGLILFLVAEAIYSRIQFRLEQADEAARLSAPASDWMEVTDAHVATAVVGEDPFIIAMDRSFYFEGSMTMDWEVSVFSVTDKGWVNLCDARGFSSSYSKFNKVPVPVRLLDWWMGISDPAIQCTQWPFPEGKTCMLTDWIFTPEGYPKKRYSAEKLCWQTVDPPKK